MSLFETKPENKLHVNYQYLIERDDYAPVREVINSWGEGILNRSNEKNKFVNEFQTTFNSSFWELYLNKAFRDMGMTIDYSKDRPDFVLSTPDGYSFNVEAVVTDPPVNFNKDSDSEAFDDNESFIDECTIKLLGAIKRKLDLFKGGKNKKKAYSELEHVKDKPFVIAVAPFNCDFSFSQNNISINQVLFGIDVPKKNGEGLLEVDAKSSVSKPNGASLELGIFTNDSFKEVSAVIFSSTGMLGKAIIESGVPVFIRATRYRKIYKYDFYHSDGEDSLGKRHLQLTPTHDVFTYRFIDGNFVVGSDTHLCQSSEYSESHLDGLHIYFNPYALIPLDPDVFDDYDITHNFFDVELKECIMEHHDQSLVSRQVIG
ncbi:hypothetical protein SMTE5_14460 [Serratia marcescens]|nr:hypothetical protein SMTE5_14460 [Serratia marcescens]